MFFLSTKKDLSDNNADNFYFLKEIVLGRWVTVVLTGIFVVWFGNTLQTHYARDKVFYSSRIHLVQKIIINFTKYRLFRSRLIVARREELEGSKRGWKLDKEFYKYKILYQINRDKYRDALYQDLTLTQMYFPKNVFNLSNEFIQWDKLYQYKTIKHLPPDRTLYKWQVKLVMSMRNNIHSF